MAKIKIKKSSPLADYIRPALYKKYRTRSLAAEDLGIDQSILSRLCSGRKPAVSKAIIEKICKNLGLDTAEGLLRLFLTKHSKKKLTLFFVLMHKTGISKCTDRA